MRDPFVRLEYKHGTSNKFYEIWVEPAGSISGGGMAGFVVNFKYGRIGTTGLFGTKTPTALSHHAALQVFMKVRDEKISKGYDIVVTTDPNKAQAVEPLKMVLLDKAVPKAQKKPETKPKKNEGDEPFRGIIL